jgi:hypothetical protein
VYVDQVVRYQSQNQSSIDASLKLDNGSHYIEVQAWDYTGALFKSSVTINVLPPQSTLTAVLDVTPLSAVGQYGVMACTARSTDSNGFITTSTIDFGDGTTQNGTTGLHNYAAAGTYNVRTTVIDNHGYQSSASSSITVTGDRNTPPSVVSVTPSSGSGMSQTFTVQISDVNGWNYIASVETLMNSQLAYAGSCAVNYLASSNQMFLINDAGTSYGTGMTAGSAGTLQNSQCSVDVSKVGVSGSGTTLNLSYPLSFKSGFAGQKNVYVSADDDGGNISGWKQLGTWLPSPAPGPMPVSVTPSSGSGMSQTFAVQISDVNGWNYIASVETLMNSQLAYAGSCAVNYLASSNQMFLINDAGTSYGTGMTAGSAGTLQNSQCSMDVSKVGVSGSGTTLNLSYPLTFKSGFAGQKNVYVSADDDGGNISGWKQLGTWLPTPAPGGPMPVSVTPSSGSGMSQTFTVQISDVNGWNYIASVETLMNSQLAYAGSCTVNYLASSNQVFLINDAGTSYETGMTAGSAGTLQNSQCSIDVSKVGVSGSGTTLNLSYPLSFKSGFAGQKNVYVSADDDGGNISGWKQLGTWTATTQ